MVGLADTVDRHYPSQASLASQRDGGSGAALASCCSYRSLGAAELVVRENLQCCFPRLELPLPIMVPKLAHPYDGKVLCWLDHTNNYTITACKHRVWRCTTTEKISFQATRAA